MPILVRLRYNSCTMVARNLISLLCFYIPGLSGLTTSLTPDLICHMLKLNDYLYLFFDRQSRQITPTQLFPAKEFLFRHNRRFCAHKTILSHLSSKLWRRRMSSNLVLSGRAESKATAILALSLALPVSTIIASRCSY